MKSNGDKRLRQRSDNVLKLEEYESSNNSSNIGDI